MSNICGIYMIENLINHKKYIGQSKEIKIRWKRHKRELNKGKHVNVHLQRSWNEYGEKRFEFSILEVCSKEELNKKEQFWIAQYHSNNYKYGYNQDEGGNNGKRNSDVKIKISKRDYPFGENTANALLSNSEVLKIQELLFNSDYTMNQIGKMFNVEGYIISSIKNGKAYSDISGLRVDELKALKRKITHPKRHYTTEQILEMFRLFCTTDLYVDELSKKLNMHSGTLIKILKKQIYKEVKTPYDDKALEIINIKKKIKINNLQLNRNFSEDDIIQIKKLFVTEEISIIELAKKYGVVRGIISSILHKYTYSFITTIYDDQVVEKLNVKNNKVKVHIKEIKRMIEEGYSNKEISVKYNIEPSCISHIRHGKTYSKI